MSKLGIKVGKQIYYMEIEPPGNSSDRLVVIVDGEEIQVTLPGMDGGEGVPEWIIINNRPYEFHLDADFQNISMNNRIIPVEVRDMAVSLTRPRVLDGRVKAPIPGLIRQLFITPGMQIDVGHSLLVLEAMKMENEILAPKAGTIRAVNVVKGQNVNLNDILVEIE